MKAIRKRIFAFALLSVLLLQLCACGGSGTAEKTSKTDFVLDTSATITVYGGNEAENETLLTACFNLCKKYEALFSTTMETSDIYKLNHRETNIVSDETAALLTRGLYYGTCSDGKFDITIEPLAALWNFDAESPKVPDKAAIQKAAAAVGYKNLSVSGNTVTFASDQTQIDLGGIAKGYIADRVADYLRESGVKRAIVNLGGNVLCIGGKTDTEGFTVGIQRPFGADSIATVKAKDLSVVTSGVYERCFYEGGKRYHHILDPSTGYPYNNNLLSVTIIGKNSCDCDALSTVCFALGLGKGLKLMEKMNNYYAVFVTEDYKVHFSNGAETALSFQY